MTTETVTEHRVVSTDWTQNWQGSLPVKITSIVLWGIAVIGFCLTVLFLTGAKEELETHYARQADHFALLLLTDIAAKNDITTVIEEQFAKHLDKLGFVGMVAEWKDHRINVGKVGKPVNSVRRELAAHLINNPYDHIVLTLYKPDLTQLLNDRRKKFLLVMVTMCVIFGTFLTWTLNKVVTSPFQALVQATQLASKGNLSVRLDSHRHDEFGKMAKFFNEMLDRISAQQIQLRNEIDEHKRAQEALEIAMAQVEAANQAKSAFLANMSHEIRTPLNAILGYTQIMQRSPELPERMVDAVQTIDSSGHHLLALINEILDISKIEAGRMEINNIDFDLIALIEGLGSMFEFRCHQNDLQWLIHYPDDSQLIVVGDESKLRQILINLVGNAVKFTESGHVLLNVTKQQQDNYMFVVEDTGMGITAKAQKLIFEPFQQGKAGTQKGGTGLGLAIAKSQIELLGGELTLTSQWQKGSSFTFIIALPPANRPLVQKLARDVKSVHLREGVKVCALVVDDNPHNRAILLDMLTQVGVTVIEAEDGLQGVNMAIEYKPDIIFMDIRMPVMDGVAALKKIRATTVIANTKCIAITASSLSVQKDKYVADGFDDFISKPFLFNAVFDSMAQLLAIDFDIVSDPRSMAVPERWSDHDLANLSVPDNTYQALLQAAELSQVTELHEAIASLAQIGRKEQLFALYLQQLLSEYDMDGIEEIMAKVQPTINC